MIILKNIKLQAHKGVESECPENTMASFCCAAMQGYDVVELDLEYTKDKRIVVLHDKTINRTARNKDGTPLGKQIEIHEITYQEALKYDFGVAVSNKFRGEKIPLFDDVLKMAKKTMIHLKIDNKLQSFPEEIIRIFFSLIKDYAAYISVTSNNIEFIKRCLKECPGIAIDYDGDVTEDVLRTLASLVPKSMLTVWLPYRCNNTSWVKLPFADEKLSELVRRYAKLGIWILNNYEDFFDAKERFLPDIIETNGVIKPIKNVDCRYDMHTHSKASHDSVCDVLDMQAAAQNNKLSGFAVTDHCDIELCETKNLDDALINSINAAKSADRIGKTEVLHGIEIGEAFWHPTAAEDILKRYEFDAVIGSVHAVKFENYYTPYSQINFTNMGYEKSLQYLDQYFDDMLVMLKTCSVDILAHLTCPLRYINGKYGMNVELSQFEDKIKEILRYIIIHKTALEINTSCIYEGSGYYELMPDRHIIKMFKDMGGYLITTGSDAHKSENSANGFDMLYSLLKELGFKNTYYYKNRCAIQCAIE